MGDKSDYWFEMVEYDLETAKALLLTKRYLYVGFMCHQVIEKSLKGLIAKQCIEDAVPHIHSLTKLAKKAELYHEMSEQHKDLLDFLEPLNVEARYPSVKEKLMLSLTNSRCKQFIIGTEELSEWIKTKSSK